jgi:hypothetical protein
MGRQASLTSSLLKLFEKNELLHTMGWKTQEGSLWAVNIHMFVYYVLLYLGYISNSLSIRFLLLWLPCTLVNLKREYMIDPHHGALPFSIFQLHSSSKKNSFSFEHGVVPLLANATLSAWFLFGVQA